MSEKGHVNELNFFQKVKVFIKDSPAGVAIILSVLLYGVTVYVAPNSLNWSAISSIAMMTILLSFAAAGQTMVLIGGGMDFSVGAVMSSASIMAAALMNNQDGRILITLVVIIAMGAAVGLLNGISTVKIGLPAMIVTMAVSNIVTRLEYVLTGGSPPGRVSPGLVQAVIGRIPGTQIPNLALFALVIWPIVLFILNRSRFGRQLYLVGNNPTAARLSGINVNRVKVLSYVLSGIFSAIAGLLGAAYIQLALCQIFDGYAYDSLIAVIVGGTSLAGGTGSYVGSIAGALLMTILNNLLTAMNLEQPIRNIVLGVVLVMLLIMYNRGKSVRQ